ncbi:MAG: HAD hydrolase-like protein [Alphaproteobacteria bacterium]
MSLQRPTIVIFDMDGTSVRHLNPRLLGILEWLDDLSYRISKFFGWIFMRGGKGPILPLDEMEDRQQKKPRLLVHRAIHKIRRKPVEQIVEPCPGIFRFLRLMQSEAIPLAIVSNGLGKGYGHEVLDTFGFDKFFQTAIFREDIRHSKPNPEPLLLALKGLDVPLSAQDVIWYVGDRHKDVKAAIAAAAHVTCKIQPIAYGVNAAAAILEKGIGTDHIIMSYYDMYTRFNALPPSAKPPVPRQKAPANKESSANTTAATAAEYPDKAGNSVDRVPLKRRAHTA